MNDRNRNFRPKPEPEPKSFRFGNSYRNRNGHFTPNSAPKICSKHNDPQSQIKKVGISIILHKNLLYRVISLYCRENISNVYWKYIANYENLENIYNIVSVLSFGSGSVKNSYFGFGPVSVKFHSGRSLQFYAQIKQQISIIAF